MRRVFAGSDRAVMAGRTDTDNLRVIDRYCRLEKRCAVTIFANIARQYMVLIFANRIRPIVTANAIADVVRMIEGCRYPAIGRMTCVAIVARRDMGRILAHCDRVVMARRTGADHLRMIHPVGRSKQNRVVAVLTNVAGQDMIEIFADRVRAIMTAETITRDIGVIEICR